MRQDRVEHARPALVIPAVLVAAVEAVFIATLEALAEIVVVVVLGYVVPAVAVVRIPVGIGVAVVGMPAILPVCLSRTVTFLTIASGLRLKGEGRLTVLF